MSEQLAPRGHAEARQLIYSAPDVKKRVEVHWSNLNNCRFIFFIIIIIIIIIIITRTS